MDFLANLFQTITSLIHINQIVFLLHDSPFIYIITIALFCCVMLLISVFSSYKILNLQILFAWILSCVITFIYLVNSHTDMEQIKLSAALHSQIILSFSSTIILLIFYLLGLVSTKPFKARKNFGRHTWWVSIVRFIVVLAFCCVFNIGLFVASALFYL